MRSSTKAILLVLGLYLAGTVQRNLAWKTEVSIWGDAAVKSPHKARPRYGIVFGYFGHQQWQEAVVASRKAMEDLTPAPFELWQQAGTLLLKQQKYHEAQSVFADAVMRDPSSIAWQNMAAAWYQEWLSGADKRDPNSHLLWLAAEGYSQSLQFESDNGWVVDGWADVYFYSGRYRSIARELFTVARVLDGTEAYVLGKWMLSLKDYAGAQQLLNIACQTRSWTICYFYKAYAYQMSGSYPQAIESYKATLAIDPTLREARYNLGLTYQAAGMKPEADMQFKESQLVSHQ